MPWRKECWIASHINNPIRLKLLAHQLDSMRHSLDHSHLDCIRIEISTDNIDKHDVSMLANPKIKIEFSSTKRSQFEHLNDLRLRLNNPTDILIMASDDDDMNHPLRALNQFKKLEEAIAIDSDVKACRSQGLMYDGMLGMSFGLGSSLALELTDWEQVKLIDTKRYSMKFDYSGLMYTSKCLNRFCEKENRPLGDSTLLSYPYVDLIFSWSIEKSVELEDPCPAAIFRRWSKY